MTQDRNTHLFETIKTSERLGLSQRQKGLQGVHARSALRFRINGSGEVCAREASLPAFVQQLLGGAGAALHGRCVLLGFAAYFPRSVHRVSPTRHRRRRQSRYQRLEHGGTPYPLWYCDDQSRAALTPPSRKSILCSSIYPEWWNAYNQTLFCDGCSSAAARVTFNGLSDQLTKTCGRWLAHAQVWAIWIVDRSASVLSFDWTIVTLEIALFVIHSHSVRTVTGGNGKTRPHLHSAINYYPGAKRVHHNNIICIFIVLQMWKQKVSKEVQLRIFIHTFLNTTIKFVNLVTELIL